MNDTISYTKLRADLAKVLDRVTEDHAPVVITRTRGKAAVLLSLEDYSELETTAHLQRSPRNAARLRAARAEVEKEIARRARRR